MYKRLGVFFGLLLLIGSSPSIAGVALREEVQRLLVAEKFARADARASAVLTAVHGTTPAASTQRLEALNALLDSALLQHHLTDDAVDGWLTQTQQLTRELLGDHARALARPLAIAARRQRLLAEGVDASKAAAPVLAQGLDLLANGTGEISASERANVFAIAATFAVDDGDYERASKTMESANTALQDSHDSYAEVLQAMQQASLAGYEQQTGKRDAANSDVQAAITRAARVGGRGSLVYATTLTSRGTIEFFGGDFLAARSTFESALALIPTTRGFEFVRGSANNYLALALSQLGDYTAAKKHAQAAIADSIGDARVSLSGRLNTAAILEKDSGDLVLARSLLDRALALAAQQRGADSMSLVAMLGNLANLALRQDDFDAAEHYAQRYFDIAAGHNAHMIKEQARTLQARIALVRAEPARADAWLGESIQDMTQAYGDRHSDLVSVRCLQAIAKARLGQYDAAFALAETAERFRIEWLSQVAPTLGETQALNLKHRVEGCAGLLLTLADRSKQPAQAQTAWRLVAAARGLATHLLAVRLANARASADEAGKARWAAWERAGRAYADLLLRADASAEALAGARAEVGNAEAQLGVPALQTETLGADSLATAAQALFAAPSGDAALVAYVEVSHFDIDAQARSADARSSSIYAWVHQGADVRLVALGETAALESRIRRWNGLLRNPASDPAELAEAGTAVRTAIWDPLAIKTAPGRVLVVPDGVLFRVNFAALPDGDGFLVEHGWRVHLLDSERDLRLAPNTATSGARGLVLLGAPAYGEYAPHVGASDLCVTGFRPLPGSASEIQRLAELWRTTASPPALMLTDHDATKAALRAAAQDAGIIHLATHAVETGPACANADTNRVTDISPRGTTTRGLTARVEPPPGAPRPAPLASATTVTPSAALALAGANDYLTRQDSSGILTSEEVVTLALDHAQWVVLSACETALGTLVDGEGVFGLRRAFRLAGARTVVMSLWQVDDVATADLMQAFYRERLLQHADTAAALAGAELAVIAARRAQGLSTHPFYWAGFVASGDWR